MANSVFIEPEVVLGTTTSWLPVTTAWPSVAGCAGAFFWFPGQPGPAGWDPGYGYFAGGSLRCLPPQATSWWEMPNQRPDGHTSLSIQPIVCPAAFTTAATEIRSISSTLVMCCPSGYDLKGGQPGSVIGTCMSSLTSGQVLAYTAQASNLTWISSTLSISSASSVSAVEMRGWNVARTATASSTASATSPTSTSTNELRSHNGLSIGAKAGIGVGIAAIIVGLLIALVIFIGKQRRRTHRSDGAANHTGHSPTTKTPVQEMPYTKGLTHELREARPAYEMPHAQDFNHKTEIRPLYEMPPSQDLVNGTYQTPVELESYAHRKSSGRRYQT